uniref:PDZ domain-containing protein n=1 Tax=Lepeophtheirus salmonis TaxID=72036 RepID=A0A0K2U0U0_LEPSM
MRSDSNDQHWLESCREYLFQSKGLGLKLSGGADRGSFPLIGEVSSKDSPKPGDVVLEIQGQKVPGCTSSDVRSWLETCAENQSAILMKVVPKGIGPV